MPKAIYILEAEIKCDLGVNWRETIEYYYYFEKLRRGGIAYSCFHRQSCPGVQNEVEIG